MLESMFDPVKATPFTARDPKKTPAFASLADMAEEQKNVCVWGRRALSLRHPRQRGRGAEGRSLRDREHAQAGALMSGKLAHSLRVLLRDSSGHLRWAEHKRGPASAGGLASSGRRSAHRRYRGTPYIVG